MQSDIVTVAVVWCFVNIAPKVSLSFLLKKHFYQPHLEQPSNWESLRRLAVTESAVKCGLWRMRPRNWDTAVVSVYVSLAGSKMVVVDKSGLDASS